MKRCGWVLLATWLAAPAGAAAQQIIGSVREDGSLLKVGKADVVLLDGSGQARGRTATDSTGVFVMNVPGSGRYRVEVRHTSYTAFTSDTFTVGPVETVTLEIRLGQNVIPLAPLVVSARTNDPRLSGFHERRLAGGFGRYLTRAEVEKKGAVRVTDLMRGIPGVNIVPVRRNRTGGSGHLIMMRGGVANCEPAIVVDGMRVRQMVDSTIDDLLDTQSVEAVEVYTSSAGAPVEFSAQGACGVVAFWTRSGTRDTVGKLSWTRMLITGGLMGLMALMAL